MFGPDGTVGSAGAAPRPGGTSLQTRVTLAFSQSHGSPVVALMRSLPATRAFAAPVIPSATHSSIASSLTLRNASFEPSGENLTAVTLAFGGSVTIDSAPPAIFFSVIE